MNISAELQAHQASRAMARGGRMVAGALPQDTAPKNGASAGEANS